VSVPLTLSVLPFFIPDHDIISGVQELRAYNRESWALGRTFDKMNGVRSSVLLIVLAQVRLRPLSQPHFTLRRALL